MNEYLLIGIGLLVLGLLYGYWSYFLKKKPIDSSAFSKRRDAEDKILPIIVIISAIIIIIKNV